MDDLPSDCNYDTQYVESSFRLPAMGGNVNNKYYQTQFVGFEDVRDKLREDFKGNQKLPDTVPGYTYKPNTGLQGK